MKKILWPNCALICVVAIAGSGAAAQTSPTAVNDPNALVPPVVYQSVFADAPKGVETQSIDWKKANADVGQFRRGHVDILKWEESNPQAKPRKPVQPVKPADSATPSNLPTTPATPARPAADLHKH
jgi:hypothetical protein